MAKIAFLAVSEDMLLQAKKIVKNINADVELKTVSRKNALTEARLSIQNGANVIISRGSQAILISTDSNIPVVEVVLTGQEIAKLIYEAKEILQKPCPVIAIIGTSNMFSSTKVFDEILDVTIKEYFVQSSDELVEAVRQASKDKVDFIIGGEIAIDFARKLNIPTLFLKSTEDSIREAFKIAEKVAYISDLEKKNTAEFKTILDYSFDGIIKLNNKGIIVVVNYLAEKILRKTAEAIIGKHITEVFNILDENVIESVLTEGKGLYHTLLQKENLALVSNIAPIIIDNNIEGAILSFQEFRKIEEIEAEIRKELYSKGYVAKSTFKHIIGESSEINELKAQAKLYAKYDSPILITGESGVSKKMFAQSIHNESLRRTNPYIVVNCASMPPDELEKKLYGYVESNYVHASNIIKKGSFEAAHTGTLLLDRISELDEYAQINLLRVINGGYIVRRGEDKALPVNVRIICATNKDLKNLIKEGKFSEDLYYVLNVLPLDISPLRKRKEDILVLLEHFMDQYNNLYKKYVVLTDGAKETIRSYPWYGNVQQLKRFCEKIVILAPKKVLDESFINKHLESYILRSEENKYDSMGGEKKIIVYKNHEAGVILELLDKYNGNRGKVAEELNISKTTLWRKMKKYNIENNFDL